MTLIMVIRYWIAKNNPAVDAKLNASPAYFYTVLVRHTRAGRLAKRSRGYRLPQNSPKGETGGMAPPASLTSPLDRKRIAPSDAEAGGI